MIQLRSGTQTARLTGASFCICEQQPETLGVSPAIVHQMERSPFIHFKLEPLHKSAPSLAKASHCKRDAICSWRGSFWLQDEHSSSSNRAVPTYTCCFWKAGIDPSAELRSVQTEGTNQNLDAPWSRGITAEHCPLQNLSAHLMVQYPISILPLLICVPVSLLTNIDASPWQNFNFTCSHNTFSHSPLCHLPAPL